MTYVEKLDAWYRAEREAGRVVDIKFFPGLSDPEAAAKVVYEIVTAELETERLDTIDSL